MKYHIFFGESGPIYGDGDRPRHLGGAAQILIRFGTDVRTMSLFRKAGKKFQETKRTYIDGDPAYVCGACEETVTEAFDYCPHCGEPAVEPLQSGEESR